MVKMRAFIAINLPDYIKKNLGRNLEIIKKNFVDDIKWVDLQNLHLTLHFLGYLEEDKLDLVKQIIEHNIKKTKEIYLEINKYGCFPKESRARVLFLNCYEQNKKYLINLQKNIGKELEKQIGHKIDYRPWKTHITFARLRTPRKIQQSNFKDFRKIKFPVKSIDLMKSELSRLGPKYSIIQKFTLIN